MEVDSGIACRICKSFSGNDLIQSPCLCKGSMGYVHLTCLERWLNQSSRNYCELCQVQLPASCRRRYGLLRSMLVWVSNPTHRAYLVYDLIIAIVLSALTAVILFISLVGAGMFTQDDPAGLQDPVARGVVLLFMFILLSSYVTTLYLIVQDHVKPWYHWWRHCVNVRLHLDTSMLQLQPNATKVTASLVNTASLTCVQSIEMLSLVHSNCSINLTKEKISRNPNNITDTGIM